MWRRTCTDGETEAGSTLRSDQKLVMRLWALTIRNPLAFLTNKYANPQMVQKPEREVQCDKWSRCVSLRREEGQGGEGERDRGERGREDKRREKEEK